MRVTALRAGRRGRVLVEVDGAPWREFPVDVVARAGIREDGELDCGRLRALARERRRALAVAAGARALRGRDLPREELRARLERAGFAEGEREHAVAALERAGWVDDGRFAAGRARVLAERGRGDAAIRADLERHGVAAEVVEAAVAALEPEVVRAAAIVARRGTGVRTAAFLARQGFGADGVELAAVGDENGDVAEAAGGAYDSNF